MRIQPGSPLAAPAAQVPRREEKREPLRVSGPRALTDTASIMGVPQDELDKAKAAVELAVSTADKQLDLFK
jgi:hypothetical protein